MDTNEKLGLIERVDRASEEQAKRTLKSMILKCTVGQPTIARALRTAIEQHAPTPTIVYEQPESEHDDEPAPISPPKRSKKKKRKKKKHHDGSSQSEEDVSPVTTNDHQSATSGDTNAEPADGQLVLKKKTKAKSKGKAKRDGDRDGQQSSSEPLKKKHKHASKPRAEAEQHARDSSMESTSKQEDPPVIDLVTSSDDDICGIGQSENEIPEDKSSDADGPDNDSPDDDSSKHDSSDNEDSENEPQEDALPGGVGPSQDGSNKNVNQAIARNGDPRSGAAQSSTTSSFKALDQNDGVEVSSFGLGMKRKAPERTFEDVHNDRAVNSATGAHLNKKTKQDHPQEPQGSLKDRTCRKCNMKITSVAEILKHHRYCNGASTTLGNHHPSEPPSGDHSHQLKQVQKVSHPAANSSIDEPRSTLQLPSRPHQRAPANPGLSVPPTSFLHKPDNFPRGPTTASLALARSFSGVKSSPPGLVDRPVPKLSADGSPGHQPQLPKPYSDRERLIPEREKVIHQCKYCKKSFTEYGNEVGACKFHRGAYRPWISNIRRILSNCALGQYRLLTEKHLIPRNFKGLPVPSQPYEAWTCCRRQGKDAPPCITGRMHARP